MADMDAGAEVLGEGFGRVVGEHVAQRRGIGAQAVTGIEAVAVGAMGDGDLAAIGDGVGVRRNAERGGVDYRPGGDSDRSGGIRLGGHFGSNGGGGVVRPVAAGHQGEASSGDRVNQMSHVFVSRRPGIGPVHTFHPSTETAARR